MILAAAIVKRSRLALVLAATASLLTVATPARAQEPDFGLRAGVSSDPTQFYFGGHVNTAPIWNKISFRPNVEIGVGNGGTAVGFNIEFAYWYPLRNQPWNLYMGGGPAANVYHANGNTDLKPGFNLLFGAKHSSGVFLEIKIGLIDSPDFKLGVGYAWGKR